MLINCANVRTRICIINVVCVGRVARCCKTLNFIINRTTKQKMDANFRGKMFKAIVCALYKNTGFPGSATLKFSNLCGST